MAKLIRRKKKKYAWGAADGLTATTLPVQAHDWQTAVLKAVSGSVVVTTPWDYSNTYPFPTAGMPMGIVPAVADDGSISGAFQLDTIGQIQSSVDGGGPDIFDLSTLNSLRPSGTPAYGLDTKAIVIEDATGVPGCDEDHNDHIWLVSVAAGNLLTDADNDDTTGAIKTFNFSFPTGFLQSASLSVQIDAKLDDLKGTFIYVPALGLIRDSTFSGKGTFHAIAALGASVGIGGGNSVFNVSAKTWAAFPSKDGSATFQVSSLFGETHITIDNPTIAFGYSLDTQNLAWSGNIAANESLVKLKDLKDIPVDIGLPALPSFKL